MKTDPGRIWINTGLLLLAAALFLWAYNGQESRRAGDAAQQVITELTQSLTRQPPAEAGADPEQTEAPAVKLPEYLLDAQREMPEKTVNGRAYIGVLSIPTLQLELPVLSQWSYPNLRVAPCRYSGSLYQNDLILCAHNYASHFGRLKTLQPGDTLLFTDMDDQVVSFQMVEQETLEPNDQEAMTTGDWDLTLFTCTPGGQTSVTLRFQRVAPDHSQELAIPECPVARE